MEMKIKEYISKYYCDENKKDLHLNDLKDDSNLICNFKFYNRFHSVWLPNDRYISKKFVQICKTKEHENDHKSNEDLNNTECNNFISFEESTSWTSLKYTPFNLLLNQLGYPVCECVEKKCFWWGSLKYQESKFEKIKGIFHTSYVNSESSEEINLFLISEIFKKAGLFKNSPTVTSFGYNTSFKNGLRPPETIKMTTILDRAIKSGKYKGE